MVRSAGLVSSDAAVPSQIPLSSNTRSDPLQPVPGRPDQRDYLLVSLWNESGDLFLLLFALPVSAAGEPRSPHLRIRGSLIFALVLLLWHSWWTACEWTLCIGESYQSSCLQLYALWTGYWALQCGSLIPWALWLFSDRLSVWRTDNTYYTMLQQTGCFYLEHFQPLHPVWVWVTRPSHHHNYYPDCHSRFRGSTKNLFCCSELTTSYCFKKASNRWISVSCWNDCFRRKNWAL